MPMPNRSNWWIWALVASLTFTADRSWAQETKKDAPPKGAATKPAAPKSGDAAKDAPVAKDAEAPQAEPEAESEKNDARFALTESFRDPRVDELLELTLVKESLPPRPNFSASEEKQLQNMAGGSGDVNPRTINRFVEAKAAELTNKKAIEAMMTGEGSVNSLVRPIEKATTALIAASRASNAAANSPFMSAYAAAMIKTFTPLLEGHLITRTQAALALASTGTLDVVPLMLKIMGDDKQPWQMKSLAMMGINNAIQEGRRPVAFTQRTQWTIALNNMLRNEEDAPWFMKAQAAQLIGNMRIISESVPERKVHPAEVLMDFLTNPDERPEVRLEAARSLGLLDITSQFRPFNHLLVVTSVAEAVADVAEEASTIPPTDSSRSQQLFAMMAEKLTPAFMGVTGMVNSGYLQQMIFGQADAKTQEAVNSLFDKIKNVINAGSAYIRARGDLVTARRADLQTRIVELRKAVSDNTPKDRSLVPSGKIFEPREASSAEVARSERRP